jgi:site-specific DNA-cytosine methylase
VSTAPVEPECATWPEAEIVAAPARAKDLDGPRLLVRRRAPLILGPRGEELIALPGQPAISLFTGAGGIDLGIEQAGFCVLCQVEWDHVACETLIMNRPNFFRSSALIQADITTLPTSAILAEANLRVGECAFIGGGPPCQGFSVAGKRDPTDARNNLIYDFLRVVREAQPAHFMMENVPGLVSMSKGAIMRDFLAVAYAGYYELVYGLVECSEYGVPQHRCRFICTGTRRDLFEIGGTLASLPRPEHFGDRDLEELRAIEESVILTPEMTERRALITHPPGIRYFPDRPVLVPPAPIGPRGENGHHGRSKAFLEFFRKLRAEEPDRIVTAPTGPYTRPRQE